jgi:tetratricopeptide (TPR) repeat protein
MRIASVLTDRRSPDEAKAYLLEVPGVRQRLVELAMAQVLTQRRQYDRALAEIEAFLARPGLPDNVRNWGRLRQADTLAAAGKRDEALALLDELQAEDVWQEQADLRKGRLLLAEESSRNEGEKLLETLAEQARKQNDLALLEQIAATFQQARMPEQALLICGHLEKLQPKEAKPLLLRAGLLSQIGNFADAEEAYEEALQRQPGNLEIYLELARLMDLQHKSPETLAVLDRLAEAGQTGKVYALFEKARMLGKGWGLLPQAIQAIDELKSMGHGKEPWIQLELANAFVQLGQPAQARSILQDIPAFSRHYLQARMMLADLEDNPQKQESILADLARRYPENPRVQEARIRLLADQEAYDQALAWYERYRQELGNRPLVLRLPELAVQIALQAGDLDAAAEITEDIASKSRLPVWRNRAILLDLARQSPQAGQRLRDKDAPSDGLTAVLGVAWAVLNDKPDQARTFAETMESIRRELADRNRNPNVLYQYAFLADLARGEVDKAREDLKQIEANLPRISRDPMTRLLEKVSQDPSARKQAARLLEALVARELELPRLAESIAEKVFQSDPSCLWAAGILMTQDPARAEAILDTIQPADGFMAQYIRGEQTLREGQYKQAYALYTKLQQVEPNNIQWLYLRAVACERMGQRKQALELYRQLLAKGMHLLAANNAAYLISQLYPGDEQQLEQAAKWIDEVVRLQPTVPAFRDTQGWILHLQGQNDRAARLVRAAAKGIPDSTEVHYHLADIEHALGNERLTRWHVDAAIELAEARKRSGKTLEFADEKALEDARTLRSKLAETPVSAGQD